MPQAFISYAHLDGAALARRLHTDLTAQGFYPWLDAQRLTGGASWTSAIEQALDQSEFVLALLTPASHTSDICRAKQLCSLRKGKCVITLKAQTGTEIPLHLEAKNYRDFTASGDYATAFAGLLADLHARNGIQFPPQFRQTYFTLRPCPRTTWSGPRSSRSRAIP